MIDELNVIPITVKKYEEMSAVVDAMVGRAGSTVIYTTHNKITGQIQCMRSDEWVYEK